MPWNAAPPMIIIMGCFTFVGLAIPGIDKMFFGRAKRTRIDQVEFEFSQRDENIRIRRQLAVELTESDEDAAERAKNMPLAVFQDDWRPTWEKQKAFLRAERKRVAREEEEKRQANGGGGGGGGRSNMEPRPEDMGTWAVKS